MNLVKVSWSFGESIDCQRSPVNVPHVEDRAVVTRHLRVGPHELYAYRCKAQVRAHAEVGNGGDQGDGSGDVVEDTIGAWLGES